MQKQKSFFYKAIFIALGYFCAMQARAADSCDAVLLQGTDIQRSSDSTKFAWLWLIDESSYNLAKNSASAGAYGDLFTGNFSSFQEKRQKRYQQSSGQLSQESSRESIKINLNADQIKAWSDCKIGKNEIAAYFEDADDLNATLVASWTSDPAIGPLRALIISMAGASPLDGRTRPDILAGTIKIILKRDDPKKPIRATITGKAGVNNRYFSASAYLPQNTKKEEMTPDRIVTSVSGRVKTSVWSWQGGNHQASAECISVNDNQDLIIIETETKALGMRKGACVSDNNACDSAGESCTDIYIKKGCIINKTWHDWYKSKNRMIPYSPHAVCD